MPMLSATRFPDWEARLHAYLEPLHALPFAWGQHDCCTFSAGAVAAMTGVDPMPEFRDAYTTATGSVRALIRHGAGDLAATMDAKFEKVPASLAHRGDVVMSDGLLGICLGAQMIAVGAEGAREGLILLPRAGWIEPRAWRVQYGF